MLNKLLFPKNNLEKSLDASWLRNDIISQNIANVDTPNYKRKEVKFEEYLNSEMKYSRISNGKSRLQGSGDIKVIEDHKTIAIGLTETMLISKEKWRNWL